MSEQPGSATAVAGTGGPTYTRVDLDGVAKRYRVGDITVTVFEGVDLPVDETSFVVIVGPSRSGKTTLLNLIGALDVPTEGRVRIKGNDITRAPLASASPCVAARSASCSRASTSSGVDGAGERAVRGGPGPLPRPGS